MSLYYCSRLRQFHKSWHVDLKKKQGVRTTPEIPWLVSDPRSVLDGMTLLWPRLFHGAVSRKAPADKLSSIGHQCERAAAAPVQIISAESLTRKCPGNFPNKLAL